MIGGIATAAVMLYLGKSVPTWALLIVSLAASLIAGAAWGAVPAIFKARYGTNETLFTLMMNYVAIQLTSYFVAIWENPVRVQYRGHHQPAHAGGLVSAGIRAEVYA